MIIGNNLADHWLPHSQHDGQTARAWFAAMFGGEPILPNIRGDGVETWEPRFTFHGFRYAEVEGWPGAVEADHIRAVVRHSDLERIGWFECSDPLVNRLHENIVWSMRGNFLDIPTDCPQRDAIAGLSDPEPIRAV